ncbi:DUF4276 family protein [Methylomonas montana]|uniref:DUF4276 family protein n=1 Tax=Methylomonas montana TaxID=3058963 RepID=UPI00265A0264|nr:DUF4276 family protein [Methylomonas montana]WKJ88810.1 DUF4276 family protein [Methylomonas montana]
MKALLDGLLPRLFPGWIVEQHFKCIPHQGKSDLDASIPRKLKAWQIPGDRFVIVRDNDNLNCVDLKARYVALCQVCGRPETLIRLVCQELESWYLGDLQALGEAFANPKLDNIKLRKRIADPDQWQKPSHELARIVPGFQKVGAARAMSQTLVETRNCSRSFQVFMQGVRRLAGE